MGIKSSSGDERSPLAFLHEMVTSIGKKSRRAGRDRYFMIANPKPAELIRRNEAHREKLDSEVKEEKVIKNDAMHRCACQGSTALR